MANKTPLFKELTKGIIKENPTLITLLGMCPTLAVGERRRSPSTMPRPARRIGTIVKSSASTGDYISESGA